MGNSDIQFSSAGWVANNDWRIKTYGNSGAAVTLDKSDETTVTMTANCTFTMPSPVRGQRIRVMATQDGTGSRTATWTGVKWAGGTPVALSTAANAVDVFAFDCYDGASWFGSAVGKAYA